MEVVNDGTEIPPGEWTASSTGSTAASVKKQIPGSGLGLSIAQSIARAHNGDLTVASRPGETVFRMTLPGRSKGRPQLSRDGSWWWMTSRASVASCEPR